MESFNFELKLVSDIDKVANKGATALRGVQSQAAKTQKTLNWGDALGKQFEKIGYKASLTAKKQHDAFAASWVKIGMQAEKSARQQEKAFERSVIARERAIERRADKLREQSLGAGLKEGLGVGNLTKASFYGAMLAEGAFKFVDVIMEGAHKIVDTFEEGISRAFEEAGKQQTLRLGERLSLGGKGGAEFRNDVNRFSKLTGFDDDAIRALLLPLRRGGMNQQASRTAFAAAADVAAGEGRGGDMGRVSEVLGDFQNIFLKGGINEKKLINLGVNAPEFYKQLAKDLKIGGKAAGKNGEGGTTAAEEAKKRAEAGKINPQVLLNAIYKGIEAKQGGKLGTGAIEFSKTFDAHLEKVKNLPNEYLKNLVDSPAFARANELLGHLLENLDPDSPAGQRIMASVENMFDRITGFVGDPKDAADSLADKVEDIIHFAEELAEDFRSWADALLPSLETLEDMYMAARKMKAFTSNDTQAQAQVLLDQYKIDQRRTERKIEKQIKVDQPERYEAALRTETMRARINSGTYDGPLDKGATANIEKAARADVEQQNNQMRKAAGIQVHAPVSIVVQAAPGEDPDKSHREAAANVHKHITRAIEQAAQEGGG